MYVTLNRFNGVVLCNKSMSTMYVNQSDLHFTIKCPVYKWNIIPAECYTYLINEAKRK